MAASDEDDASLIRAALAGDPGAFSALMGRHKSGLYRFVLRYVGDADEALDLVQDTFVACWSALNAFDQTRSFPTWLRRISLNKCRDWSRRRKVRQFFFGAMPLRESDTTTTDAETPDDGIERKLVQLDDAISALPSALKEPLILTAFAGLSHVEAASLLGVSPKAIETRIYRAKQQLRRSMGSGA